MSGTDADAAQVPNRYRAAVSSARASSSAPADVLATALDKAVRAMSEGAWTGGTSGDFEDRLTSWRTTCRNASDGAMAEFDDTLRRQPDLVDPDSWQARWRPWRR